MFRNMVTSLFKHERIRTTDAKAKEVRRWADKLITLAKRGDLHARRQALSIIREKDVVHKLFTEAPERFAQVQGGYTRVVKVGFRPGDAAPVSMVELVTPEVKKKKARRKKKSQTAAASGTAAPATAAAETVDAQESAPVVEALPAGDSPASAETEPPEAQGGTDGDTVTAAADEAAAETETQTSASAPVDTAAEEKPDAEAPAASEDDAAPEQTPPKES